MKKLRIFLWGMVVVAAGLFGLFAYQLHQPKDTEVPSEMIGQPMPQFDLPPAIASLPGLSFANLANGKPHLLNFFASWCVPCRIEEPQLEELKQKGATIVGIAVRDHPADVQQYLQAFGNPYSRIGADNLSKVQLAIGSSGVPETFVIDGKGIIRYQHIGAIYQSDIPFMLKKLQEAGA